MGRTNNQHRRRFAVALITTGAIALSACGGNDDDAASASASEVVADEAEAATGGDSVAIGGEQPADAPIGAGDTGGFDLGSVGRDVIVEMRVVVSSDDIQRTVSSITATASSLGGGIASSDVDYGTRSDDGTVDGYAVIVVKVPPASIDTLLGRLDDTGTVESINQSAQDVTEQLVDLDVRIENARASVEHVREFMERTQDLKELVALEGELTRRQTELEQLEAQQRNLSERVALSTITIEVVPTAAVPAPEPDEGIGDAFRTGWDAFVTFFFGLGFVLAVLAPFLLLAALVATVAWSLTRRLRRPPAPDTAAPQADAAGTGPVSDDQLVGASHED